MIPPQTKQLILTIVQKYAPLLYKFKNSNPVVMIAELKLDRIDQKVRKEGEKLNDREMRKDVKSQGGRPKRYEKRKAAITYKSYTVEFKRRLIDKIREMDLASNQGLSKIIRSKARELSIHPKNIFRWFHTKEIKKKEGGRKALYPQMQERLAQFIIANPKMKRKHILRQAKQIMEDLQIPGREYFNFSKGWYERFRERLVRRKIIPGKIEVKREFGDGSDSDFDESEEVKKEEAMFKEECQVKMEYEDGDGYESDSRSEEGMDEDLKDEKPTKMNCDDLVLNYNLVEISQDNEQEKEENKQKDISESKKEELKKKESKKEVEKQQAKTDQSESHNHSQTISVDTQLKK